MAAAALPIASSMPPEYNVDDPQTSSAFVLRRNYVELLPNEQIVFQPQSGQDMIRFIINDQSSFWMSPQSYFRFQLKVGNSALGAVSNLRVGGVGLDSLFRMIELRSVASGTVLMRQNFYNYGVMAHQYYLRPDKTSIGDAFDLQEYRFKQPRQPNKMVRIPEVTGAVHTIALGTTTAGTILANQNGVITLNQVNGIGLINVGDIIHFEMQWYELKGGTQGAANSQTASVSAATGFFVGASSGTSALSTHDAALILQKNQYEMVVTLVSVATASVATTTVTGEITSKDFAAGTIKSVRVEQRNIHKTQAAYVCDNNWHTVCWQPMNSVFWQNWPLFLLKGGLELVLYLENPNVAFVQDATPAVAATALGYQIQSPRLVAMMSTPEPSIQRDFIGKWNSDQGIVYFCPQLETRKMQGNATDGTMVLNVPFGKRSIRNMMFNIIPSNIANGSGALGIVHDAFRSNIRSHLRYLWIQVAANYFPARRIELDDEANEMLWQTKNSLATPFSMNTNLEMEKYQHKRYENADCYYWTSATGAHFADSGLALASKKFETRDRIYSVNFARTDGKGGILSGIDGSISSVDVMLDRNGYNYNTAYALDESRTGEVNALADTGESQWGDSPVYMIHAYYDHFINLASRGILVLN